MRRLVILITLILLTTSTVWAAESTGEMILLRRENPAVWANRYGDLYTFNPGQAAPTRLTTLGNISAPALSPDGKTIAYAAIDENIMAEAASGIYTFDVDRADPMDIWIMNVVSHQFKRITNESTPTTRTYRSDPVWSPDNQQLAWFTWDNNPQGGSVVTYDLATGKETVLATGLMMNKNDGGIFNLPNLVGWGTHIAHTVYRTTSSDSKLWLETVDSTGQIGRQVIAQVDYLPRIEWVRYQDSWWVATQTMDDKWQLIQPETQQQIDVKNPPILQLPDGEGAKLKPVSTGWEILAANNERIPVPYDDLAVLSPDGQSVVYLRERKAFFWREKQEIESLLPGEAANWEIITVLWSPMIWVAN